jgi:hypothetical protein
MNQPEQHFETSGSGVTRSHPIRSRARTSFGAGAVAMILAASLTACGSSDNKSTTAADTSAAASTTATQTTTTAADNGVSAKSADEIVAAAKDAANGATAVHVSGSTNEVELDLTLVRGKGATGRIAQGPNQFQIIAVGQTIFLKGSDDFYRQIGGEGAVQLLGDRWLKVPATSRDFGSFAELTEQDKLMEQVLTPEGHAITKGDVETVDGQQAVPLTGEKRKGTLYVAATGEPFPLQIVQTGARGKIVFDGWNKPVELTAPSGVVDVAELKTQNG